MTGAVAGSLIEAAEGADGWLFLRRYNSFDVFEWQADLSGWTKTHLPMVTAEFADRHRRLAARGIPYVVAIAPEKASVYPEKLPSGYRIATPTAAELLTSACAKAGVGAIDLTALLRSAKGAMEVYGKVDTHWNFYGAFVAYRAIVEAINKSFSVPMVGPEEVSFIDCEGFGDLGVHMTPERKGRLQQSQVKTGSFSTVVYAYDDREHVLQSVKSDRGRGKALVIRDSFSGFLAPYLSLSFAETNYAAAAPALAMLDDMIADLKPDVVIHEQAERGLPYKPDGLEDWQPRSWRQLYFEAYEHPQHNNLIRRFRQALIESRFKDAIALGQELSGATGGALDHDLAEAFVMSGAHDRAIEVCETIEARRGPDAFALYLKALAERNLGRREGSIASLRRALAIRPGHARFLFLLGSWLAADNDREGAAAALQAAVERAPALAQGWQQLSLAQTRLGNRSAADFALQRASELTGAN